MIVAFPQSTYLLFLLFFYFRRNIMTCCLWMGIILQFLYVEIKSME